MLFCESYVGNGHLGQMLFSVGRGWYSAICCALFRGVFDASVVAVEDQLVVRGFGLTLFCEVILVSSAFLFVYR